MGSMLKAICKCGYSSTVMMGGGMRDFTKYCGFPFYCEDCKIMFTGNAFDKKLKCPECGSKKVIAYDDDRICKKKGEEMASWATEDKIGRDLVLTDGRYLCPECGKFNLSFVHFGCFD